MAESVYVHIPFCKSKCKYCSFVSYNKLNYVDDYINALLKSINCTDFNLPLKTLYIGGGTPSLLTIQSIKSIIDSFDKDMNCEVTIEVNPDDCSYEYLEQLLKIGVNRLSIGSQTFDDRILTFIGRRHNSFDIMHSANLAKEVGFTNVSLDLIYGLPYQTIEGLKADIDKILSLDIQHVSTYGLKIDEECAWGKYYNSKRGLLEYSSRKKIMVPDDDTQADMYEMINLELENCGYYRYEVSNFAKEGFGSKHNLNYWNNNEYYGFGVAAHGYIDGIRYANTSDINKFIKEPYVPEVQHTLTIKEKIEEEIFLGFRKRAGINTSLFKQKFNIDFEKQYCNILNKYSSFIEKTKTGYALNLKGVLVSNVILSEFI